MTHPSAAYRNAILAYLRLRLEMRASADPNRAIDFGIAQVALRASLESAGRDPLACLRLTSTEREVVWMAAGFEIDRELRRLAQLVTAEEGFGLTHDRLQRLCYNDVTPSFRELGPNGRLRRLGILERSDGGGADVHDSRQTFTIARRMLAWLHGDESLDPDLAGIVRIEDDPRSMALPRRLTRLSRQCKAGALSSWRAECPDSAAGRSLRRRPNRRDITY